MEVDPQFIRMLKDLANEHESYVESHSDPKNTYSDSKEWSDGFRKAKVETHAFSARKINNLLKFYGLIKS